MTQTIDISGYIIALEQSPHWQATAETKDGHLVSIIRGHEHGQFENPEHFSVYDGRSHLGLTPFTARGIRMMFESGELNLLRGSVPVS